MSAREILLNQFTYPLPNLPPYFEGVFSATGLLIQNACQGVVVSGLPSTAEIAELGITTPVIVFSLANNSGFLGMISGYNDVDFATGTANVWLCYTNINAIDIRFWVCQGVGTYGYTALLSYINGTNQNTRYSSINGTPNAPTPTVKWTYNPPVGSSFNENQIVIGKTGILYVAEDSGKLLAITDNGANASTLWSVDTGFTGLVPPVLGDDSVLYGVGTNTMKAVSNISTASPSVVWTADLTPLVAPLSPLLQYDTNGVPTIYVSGTGKIYSINYYGVVNWSFTPINNITYLGIKPDGSVIYATAGNQLYAITNAGVQKWVLTVGTGAGYPTIGDDGTIYFVCANTFIYAVTDNGASGTVKWTLNTSAVGFLNFTLAIGANNVIYTSNSTTDNANTKVWAIQDNGASGAIKWTAINLPTNPQFLTAVTIGNNGTLYVTGDYGYIACITDNGASYTVNWGFQPVGAGFSSPCSIGANNRIYYGGDHDYIIAV
jgi:hypothetical protein